MRLRRYLSRNGIPEKGKKFQNPRILGLGNDAVILDGTVLYADLDDSTNLVDHHEPGFAAEIYKTYLNCAAKVIRVEGGVITSYDGDRIMSVYIGKSKNSSAAQSALKINYTVTKIINPILKKCYPKANYCVKQVVGIDTSELFVARTGIPRIKRSGLGWPRRELRWRNCLHFQPITLHD